MREDTIGRPMEILLIEDSLVDARLAIGALKQSPVRHRLTLVRDGQEALDFLHRLGIFAAAPRPDLILLDLLLPKKSGLAVLEEIKQHEDLRGIPVVILTASDDEGDREQTQRLRAESYITKPVDLEKFQHVIKQLRANWFADLVLP